MKSFNTSMFVYLYNLISLLICLRIILFICVYKNSICIEIEIVWKLEQLGKKEYFLILLMINFHSNNIKDR